MIEFKGGKKNWQVKTVALNICACWDCLRRNGITPGANSHESHRRNILPGSPTYRTDNGLAGHGTQVT